jgi:hypothetical protein
MSKEEIVVENAASRQALAELVSTLSEDSYHCPVGPHWTVATTLCHLSFWDRRALSLMKFWASGAAIEMPKLDAPAIESINQAVHWIALAVPGLAAGGLALESADAVDIFVAQVSDDLAQPIEAARFERYLRRSLHRREHLNKILHALSNRC